jgi:hypothetical protein
VSGIVSQACRAVLVGPNRNAFRRKHERIDRINQQKSDRGNGDEPQQQRAQNRQQNIGRRIEQPGTQKADETGGFDRRGALGNEFLPDKELVGDIAHVLPIMYFQGSGPAASRRSS